MDKTYEKTADGRILERVEVNTYDIKRQIERLEEERAFVNEKIDSQVHDLMDKILGIKTDTGVDISIMKELQAEEVSNVK